MRKLRWHQLAVACGLLLGSASAQAAPAVLHVQGNKVVNERGQTVRLQGVSIASLEWSNEGEHVLESSRVALEQWGANCIRLPLAQDRWFGKAPYQDDGGAAYRKLVDDVIAYASGKDAYVLLDLHWSNAGEWGHSIGQHKMPDANSEVFWIALATHYANRPGVLFDLYNEPHDVSWDIWQKGGEVEEEIDGKLRTYTTPGLQKLVTIIRAAGARNLLVAGGLDWGYDLSEIPKGRALDNKGGQGIMYGAHIYPWKGNQPEWNSHVGDIAKQYPVFVGEVGCEPDPKQENPQVWAPKILKYIADNGLSWTGWCFHPGATPRMLTDWNYTPTPFWGAFAKAALQDAAKQRRAENHR